MKFTLATVTILAAALQASAQSLSVYVELLLPLGWQR
jgi:hypothetical protein